jgi:hypothetical protein
MRLALLAWAAGILPSASANVEKVIFTGPASAHIPNFVPNLDQLRLEVLSPTQHTLPIELPVTFPTESQPRGSTSWFILDELVQDQRYEVRVCWAATVSLTHS